MKTNADRVPIIEAQGVNFSFGVGESRRQVLFDNTLRIHAGEIVIMTGPSGSGKTTLLTLIGGLRALQEGSLAVMGRQLLGADQGELMRMRRHIGFIFQAHNLFEALSARQNVQLAAELGERTRDAARAKAEAMLSTLGLGERLRHKPQKLSGGQRQRVAIGRALVHEPQLVLADEPTSALDKDTGRQVVELFQRMTREQGTTVLIVTHDNRILDVADRIVNMIDGRVVSDVDMANSLTLVGFLRKCPVFTEAAPAFLADTAGKLREEHMPTGTVVIREGDVGDKFYLLQAGRVSVTRATPAGPETLAELGPGDFFGELALLRDEPRAATVTALEDLVLLSLSAEVFKDVVRQSQSFEEQLRRAYFHR